MLAATAIQAPAQTTVSLTAGWNLLGNSSSTALNVPTDFGTQTNVITMWKWVRAKSGWAFYAPSLAGQALTDYATSKGYEVLSTINGGEGFWVNANTSFTAQLPKGTMVTSASFQAMPSGWNLIAVGDSETPTQFNALAFGAVPLTTLWGWDAVQSNWYFYAPSLEASGTLASYVTSKGYLNFESKVLGPTMGFWVNAPSRDGLYTGTDYWQIEDTGLVILNDNANTTRTSSGGIESFDLNGDGVMDSIVVGPEFEIGAVYPPGAVPLSAFKRQSAHVLLGGPVTSSGASLFSSGRPTYVASGWPLSYDFNGDGRRDIFIADLGPDTAPNPGVQSVVWLSTSAGWAPATMQPALAAMHGASAGRVAGQPAIFAHATCCGTEFVPFLYVFRNGVFEVDRSLLPSLVTDSIPNTVTDSRPFSAFPKRTWTGSTIADLDGDGLDDLVLGNFSAMHPEDPLIGSYVVFGTSSGWQSGAVVRLPDPQGGAITTLTILSVKAVDLDGDGKKDLVLGYTAYYNTRGIQILRNNGDRTFTDISTAMLGTDAYMAGSPSGHLYAVDLNGDGCIDLVEPESSFAGGTSELGRMLLNDCRGHFVKANAALASVLSQVPSGATILPFTDYTGRTSFYVPLIEPPSATSNGLYGTRYKKLRNLRNLPTPASGAIVF